MKRLAILGILVLISVSCGPYRAGTQPSPIQSKEKVLLLDHGMTYYLHVTKQAASKLPGGQLQVKMEMQNEEDQDVWTDVQVIFRGEDGFEVEKTDWEPFQFHRRTVTLFQRNSLSDKATDYLIQIRNVKSR